MDNEKELQEMSLERRLAILNISQARVPVPPPRVKKTQKRMASLPNKLSFSSTKAPELYGEKAHSFDSDTRDFYSGTNIDQYRYSSQIPENQSYSKYEVPRKDNAKEYSKHRTYTPPMCDIIESSQRTSSKPMLRRPDILRGSLSADLQAMLAETESKSIKRKDSKRYSKQTKENGLTPQKGGSLDDNKNLIYRAKKPSTSTDKQQVNNNSCDSNTSKTKVGQISPRKHHPMTSTPNTKDSTGTNRFMFYRPKMDKLQRQHNIIELGGTNENMGRQSISLTPSPEGSFVNPAFEIVDMPKSEPPVRTQTIKSVATTSRPVYSTMGSAFSTRPCTPSPPSHRFRNSKPPLPPVEPTISPIKPPGPTPLKPMLSAKQLEQSLKQYSSQSRLDTTDMCSPQALENMMKYYKINSNDSHSAPPPTKLSASKKNQSPYSSSGSLNVSGDSIDVVLRRKKKVKIRPLSFSSDDESVKRVSLEINLAPSSSESQSTKPEPGLRDYTEYSKSNNTLSTSQTSLNQVTVERLDLDDMTSTETAKLLRKQFAKLKVKASSLKVKDTELKQRFALLQNQRGRVCGHGGSVSKTKIRSSPILL